MAQQPIEIGSDRAPWHGRRLLALIAVVLALLWVGVGVRADDPDNCLLCHQYRALSRLDPQTGRAHIYFVDPDYSTHMKGPHARLACTDCHARDEVTTIPHKPVTPVNCATQCHLAGPAGTEQPFSHAAVADMLEGSVHTREILSKLKFTRGPLLHEGQSSCLYCHDEPIFRDPTIAVPAFADLSERMLDRCDVCHSQQLPTDINYFMRHVASRLQPARSTLELAQVCAVCHSDPQVLADHSLPQSVASFVRSFHGKAALLGDETTASCLSCHVNAGENVHLMLGKRDERSSVHHSRIADSCRSTQCHPGADPTIADMAVHLDLPAAQGTLEFAIAVAFIVLTILTFGPSALLVLLDLLQIVIGRTAHGDPRMIKLVKRIEEHPLGAQQLVRFKVRHRVQHWILTVLFVLLVITGFPLKFADRDWAAWLIQLFGGLGAARVTHHWAGIALVVGFLMHMLDVFFVLRKRAQELMANGHPAPWVTAFTGLPMWISMDDAKKSLQLFAHLLCLRKERPSFGRFSPAEKFEYLGVFWGTMLLGITGVILWAEQISSHIIGGRVFNIATIAHTYEAFLAVIHVGILHIYNVILSPKVFPLSRATITGETPLPKLVEEHTDLIQEVASDLGIAHPETGDPPKEGHHAV